MGIDSFNLWPDSIDFWAAEVSAARTAELKIPADEWWSAVSARWVREALDT